jgi:hypothetical protein
MKTENYTKKDGKPGIRYALEKGDVIKAMVSTPREASLGKSKFPSYSIKAIWGGKEIYITLTSGQYKRLIGIGSLEGKKLVAIGYQGPASKELIGLDVLE